MEKDKKIKLAPVFDIFEDALKTWWKNLQKIIMVYLWGLGYALIPMVVVGILLGINYMLGDKVGFGFCVATIIISILCFLVAFYFLVRAYLGVFLLVKHDYPENAKKLFAESRQYFWPYFFLVLMTSVFVLLWALLLIIPGIIYATLYSFACYALFFEDKRGMKAIKRSIQLVTGYFWPVLGRFLFVGVIVWLFAMILSLPLSFFHGFMYSLWNGVIQVVNFLVGPMVLIYTYSIYKELVHIKKKRDIHKRISRFDAAMRIRSTISEYLRVLLLQISYRFLSI